MGEPSYAHLGIRIPSVKHKINVTSQARRNEETQNSLRDRRGISGPMEAKSNQLLFWSCDSASEALYYPSMSRDNISPHRVLRHTQAPKPSTSLVVLVEYFRQVSI